MGKSTHSIANTNAVINPPVIQKFRSKIYIICVPEIFHINVSLQEGSGMDSLEITLIDHRDQR